MRVTIEYRIEYGQRKIHQARPGIDHRKRSAKARGGDIRKQEQGGRAVPIRRVAVCGPDCGKIDGGTAVLAFGGVGICKQLLGFDVQSYNWHGSSQSFCRSFQSCFVRGQLVMLDG